MHKGARTFSSDIEVNVAGSCVEMGRDWEEGLPWFMLDAREVVQESTGFSPNCLVFGHSVHDPLAVLHDGLVESEPPKTLVSYVNGFHHRLYTAFETAHKKFCSSANENGMITIVNVVSLARGTK